jgi:Domain of unknown function (DUF4287)/Domain of unknown function (DUF5655)
MSFQGYLKTIEEKTGKPAQELVSLARKENLAGPEVKASEVIDWLARDFGLGRGHAMAVFSLIKQDRTPPAGTDEKIARHFEGKRAHWRPAFEKLARAIDGFGSDTDVDPGTSYLSLRRAKRKFAIVKVTAERLDVGLKLSGQPTGGRREPAGSWNSMVTHRVRVRDEAEIDEELLGWLRAAYDAA